MFVDFSVEIECFSRKAVYIDFCRKKINTYRFSFQKRRRNADRSVVRATADQGDDGEQAVQKRGLSTF